MEWTDLKQYIALKVSRDKKYIDDAGKILASVCGYKILLEMIEKDILPQVKNESGIKSVKMLEEILKSGFIDKDWEYIYSVIWDFDRRNSGKFKRLIIKKLQERLTAQSDNTEFPFPEILSDLGIQHHLSREELSIIAVHYLAEKWDEFASVLRIYRSTKKINRIAELCGMDSVMYITLVRSGSVLQSRGFIQVQRGRFDMDGVEVTPSISFALDSGNPDLLKSGLFRKKRCAVYKLNQFAVEDADIGFITGNLETKQSVLIAGDPGTGKTEFAYSVAKFMGKTIMELDIDPSTYTRTLNKPTARDRLLMLKMAQHFINPEKEILLIDEADSLLQSASDIFGVFQSSGSYDKGELNILLEELETPTIWITNAFDRIPASSLRRFGYIFSFPMPDAVIRKRMLKEKLEIKGLNYDDAFIEKMSREFEMTPSSMGSLVNAVTIILGKSVPAYKDSFKKVAKSFIKNTSRSSPLYYYRKLETVSERFNPLFTSSSIPPDEIIAKIKKRIEHGKPIRILFEGPSGGGKTEFAIYIAGAIKKEAVIKRPSDFMSKFVGETERNIRTMFSDAENFNKVLIIDEADSLFLDRSMAVRSWELSLSSEILQELQSFNGILVACTNRVKNLDPAIYRRFHQIISFGFLERKLVPKILETMFPETLFTKSDMETLYKNGPYMISDFTAAADFLEMEDPLNSNTVINYILDNSVNRNRHRKIGFGQI